MRQKDENMRKLILLAATVLVMMAGVTSAGGAATAATDPSAAGDLVAPTTVTAAPLPTWQTNGVVYAVEAVGNVVYVGGSFTSVRPPGAAVGLDEVPRRNLAAFDATTGALLDFSHAVRSRNLPIPAGGYDKTCVPGTAPDTYTCDTVYEIRVAPDASTIYVGGDFETIDGKQRPKLAAFSTRTGALAPFRVTGTNGRVRSMAVTGDRVFYGGNFTASSGEPRIRLASVDRATGVLTSWNPTSDGTVLAIALSTDGRVMVGGDFDSVNGESIRGIAPLDATTGALLRWDTRLFPGTRGTTPRSYVTDLAVDGDTVYASANGERSFDGRIAFDPATGQARWIDNCLGATWAVEIVGDVLYSGSHAHNCVPPDGALPTPGGFPEANNGVVDPGDKHYHRLLAQTARTGTTTTILHWFPTTNGGLVGKLGPRDLTHTATTLWVAGEFTTVDDRPQQSLTRFGYAPEALRAAPVRPSPPLAVSDAPGTVEVRWEATTDTDDENLTYTLYRGTTAIATSTAASKPYWVRPQMSFTDTGRTPGETVTYQVRATDPSGRPSTKSWATSVVVADVVSGYRERVVSDGADLYWPLEEASSRYAGSLTAAGGLGRYASTGVTYRTATATPAVPRSASVTLDGTTGRVRGWQPTAAPDVFSAEVWFKTSTTRGGKILGFGSSNVLRSPTRDRHVWMGNGGRLSFGVISDGTKHTISTTKRYNDGAWHHLVVSNGRAGMRLYVDGTFAVHSTSSYDPDDYTGFWQLGGDALAGWTPRSASLDFAGSLDEFAVYPYELDADTIAAHRRLAATNP
jgi:hypothetical protein